MARRRNGRSLSIGAKMLFSHMLLAGIILVLASLLSYVITYNYLKQRLKGDLLEKAVRIAESSFQMPGEEYMPNRYVVRTYAYLTDAQVFFLDADTETIRMSGYPIKPELPAGSGEDRLQPPEGKKPVKSDDDDSEFIEWVEVKDAIDREFVGRVLAGEKVSAVRRFEFAEGQIIFAGAPILDEDGAVRSGVILAQPVAELNSLSKIVGYHLLFIVTTALLMSVILATELSNKLVGPIKRITLAARHMETGVYAEHITNLPSDEIGELGNALNNMASRLMEVIGNLRKLIPSVAKPHFGELYAQYLYEGIGTLVNTEDIGPYQTTTLLIILPSMIRSKTVVSVSLTNMLQTLINQLRVQSIFFRLQITKGV